MLQGNEVTQRATSYSLERGAVFQELEVAVTKQILWTAAGGIREAGGRQGSCGFVMTPFD